MSGVKRPRSVTPARERLAAGSPCDMSAAGELVERASDEPVVLRELVRALNDERPVVQHRAARALKKIQEDAPRALDGWARPLLEATLACQDLRTRWNLLIVCGNFLLHGALRSLAVDLMFENLNDASAMVRTFALQGLVNFAQDDPHLRKRLLPIVQAALENPSPAMRARARKLMHLVKT